MEKILEVKDLQLSFHTFAGEVKAIRGVNFELLKGETLAIVGESGSGKSVTTKAIMHLLPESSSEFKSGEILFNGKDLTKLSDKQMKEIQKRIVKNAKGKVSKKVIYDMSGRELTGKEIKKSKKRKTKKVTKVKPRLP